MNNNSAIRAEGISKRFTIGKRQENSLRSALGNLFYRLDANKEKEDFWALENINFEVKKGEAVGIIGKNGAGKSTLLKILSNITKPSSGIIELNGRVSSLLEVGTGFHPELSGRENIFLNGTILGMSRKEVKSKFDEIVDFSGVEKFIDTPVKHYSSGMYVRLAFAVAAHLEPEILIIDEVLAVGDAEFQKKCIGKMEDVSKNHGKTILFVSHNMSAVKTLCSKGMLLKNGNLIGYGAINEIIQMYSKETKIMTNNIRESKGTFDLTRHLSIKDVKYSSLKKIKTYCDNELSDLFYGGCSFHFDIEIENLETYDNLLYGFVIKDVLGEPLIGINNRHTGHNFLIPKKNKIIFRTHLPKLPIYREGQYSVDLYWGNYNTSNEIIYDAFSFEIEKVDVFKTANLLDSKLNLIYSDEVNLFLINK